MTICNEYTQLALSIKVLDMKASETQILIGDYSALLFYASLPISMLSPSVYSGC